MDTDERTFHVTPATPVKGTRWSEMRADRKRLIGIVCLLLLGAAIGLLLQGSLAGMLSPSVDDWRTEATPRKDKKLIVVDSGIATALGIQTATAGPANLATESRVVGTVAFDDTKMARLAVRVSGTVRQVSKNIGDNVMPGEVLAVLDSRDIADAKSTYLAG
jgi:cobalt-zinc-cadmium efflux system membrane fusion protein